MIHLHHPLFAPLSIRCLLLALDLVVLAFYLLAASWYLLLLLANASQHRTFLFFSTASSTAKGAWEEKVIVRSTLDLHVIVRLLPVATAACAAVLVRALAWRADLPPSAEHPPPERGQA